MTDVDNLGIHVDISGQREDIPGFDQEANCPEHPGAPVETGFGLAGGGFGVYSYCKECGKILTKSQVEED